MSGLGICRAVASGYQPPAERSASENHRITIFDFQKANVPTLVLDKHRLFEAFGARGYAVASRYVAMPGGLRRRRRMSRGSAMGMADRIAFGNAAVEGESLGPLAASRSRVLVRLVNVTEAFDAIGLAQHVADLP